MNTSPERIAKVIDEVKKDLPGLDDLEFSEYGYFQEIAGVAAEGHELGTQIICTSVIACLCHKWMEEIIPGADHWNKMAAMFNEQYCEPDKYALTVQRYFQFMIPMGWLAEKLRVWEDDEDVYLSIARVGADALEWYAQVPEIDVERDFAFLGNGKNEVEQQ